MVKRAAFERSAQTTFDGPPGVAAPGGHFHVRPPQGGGLIRQKTFRRINPTKLVGQGQNCKKPGPREEKSAVERPVQLLHSTGLPVSAGLRRGFLDRAARTRTRRAQIRL